MFGHFSTLWKKELMGTLAWNGLMNNLENHAYSSRKIKWKIASTAWKVSKYGVFSGPVFSCIRIEYRKLRTRKNSVFGHFLRSTAFQNKTVFCFLDNRVPLRLSRFKRKDSIWHMSLLWKWFQIAIILTHL